MKKNPKEITLLYNSESSLDRKTYAMAKSVTNYVSGLEYHKTKVSNTQWKEVLDMLQLRPKDLMNKAHPYYQEHIKGRSFDDEGWLNVLSRNPDLIRAPIAIRGRKALLCSNPADVLQLT